MPEEKTTEEKTKKLTETLLEVYNLADEADSNIQEYWPELESAIKEEIMDSLEEVASKLEKIEMAICAAFGGQKQLMYMMKELKPGIANKR